MDSIGVRHLQWTGHKSIHRLKTKNENRKRETTNRLRSEDAEDLITGYKDIDY